MNKKNRSLLASLALFVTATLPLSARADFDAALFGMAGMVAGETVRVCVTNIAAPTTTPPNPSRPRCSLPFVARQDISVRLGSMAFGRKEASGSANSFPQLASDGSKTQV
ncbi:hypothetical protein ACV229_33060 [Burkholderia sp. MR1-5-21]